MRGEHFVGENFWQELNLRRGKLSSLSRIWHVYQHLFLTSGKFYSRKIFTPNKNVVTIPRRRKVFPLVRFPALVHQDVEKKKKPFTSKLYLRTDNFFFRVFTIQCAEFNTCRYMPSTVVFIYFRWNWFDSSWPSLLDLLHRLFPPAW